MKSLQRSNLILAGNPERVLCRMFIPGEEELIQGQSRIPQVIQRCLDMDESEVTSTLKAIFQRFTPRHRNIREQFHSHFHAVTHLVDGEISEERQILIGAYLGQEYAIEGAAYFNPSIVPMVGKFSPDGPLHFVLSVRAVGEGHISTIVFRTGIITHDGIHIDPASPYATTRAHRFTVLRNRMVRQEAIEAGVSSADLELVLGLLPDKFTIEDLTAALTQLDVSGMRNAPSDDLVSIMGRIALSNYEVDFPEETEISERVLWPTAPVERRGMEDARFTLICDDDDCVRYRATYTGFDGTQVICRALETDDFRTFSSISLTGPGVRNKGLAFFPRRVDGTFTALSRCDRESNFISRSEDGYHWNDVHPLHDHKQPWELVHSGNCGSPLETDAGWLVFTHGAGPVRQYAIGAMLLDLNDPTRVIGRLRDPFLEPIEGERDGYVPNVIYSCGSVIHDGTVVIPYGFSDWKIRFATVEVSELLEHMT